jgi:hypothetical protein
MKKLVLLGLILQTSIITLTGYCEVSDTPEARKAAAAEYLKVYPVNNELKKMVNNLSIVNRTEYFSKLTPDQQKEAKHHDEEIQKLILTKENTALMEKAALDSLVKNFTAGEIKALTKFYSTKEGAAVFGKLPAYFREITTPIFRQIGPEMVKLMPHPPVPAPQQQAQEHPPLPSVK